MSSTLGAKSMESAPLLSENKSGMAGMSEAGTSITPVIHRKVDHVHKLERKHSSGDLHSRLKTRKLLGVGETDDGDVHRSKLSQILGHSEQLYIRLPRGLRMWQFTCALMFSVIAVWALLFPRHLFSFTLSQDIGPSEVLPVRLYGAALLSFAVVFWSTLRSQDKDVIRWGLLASIIYFAVQAVVTTLTLLEQGTFLNLAFRLLSHRILFAVISLIYYAAVGDKTTKKIRKSNSTKDLSKEQ